MLLAHKVRLDPNNRQASLLAQHCGYARKAFNHGLADFKAGLAVRDFRPDIELRKRFNQVKRTEYPWSLPLSQVAAKNAIRHLGAAIGARFGKRKDGRPFKRRNRFPRWRKRGIHDSCQADNGPGTIRAEGMAVRLPAVGVVRMMEELRFPGVIRQCTVSKKAGRWYASFMLAVGNPPATAPPAGVVGVDVGLVSLAVTSDGIEREAPRYLRRGLRQLAKLQRVVSRRKKGSARREKAKRRVSRLHQRIRDRRGDTAHQVSTAIVKRASRVVVETLNLEGMVKNRRLALSVSDAGLAGFLRMLEYECERYGREFQAVSQWFPSSKLCSWCGWRNAALTLKHREWECGGCGRTVDRDGNAARNLMKAGSCPVGDRGNRSLARGGRHPLPEAEAPRRQRHDRAGRPCEARNETHLSPVR